MQLAAINYRCVLLYLFNTYSVVLSLPAVIFRHSRCLKTKLKINSKCNSPGNSIDELDPLQKNFITFS